MQNIDKSFPLIVFPPLRRDASRQALYEELEKRVQERRAARAELNALVRAGDTIPALKLAIACNEAEAPLLARIEAYHRAGIIERDREVSVAEATVSLASQEAIADFKHRFPLDRYPFSISDEVFNAYLAAHPLVIAAQSHHQTIRNDDREREALRHTLKASADIGRHIEQLCMLLNRAMLAREKQREAADEADRQRAEREAGTARSRTENGTFWQGVVDEAKKRFNWKAK